MAENFKCYLQSHQIDTCPERDTRQILQKQFPTVQLVAIHDIRISREAFVAAKHRSSIIAILSVTFDRVRETIARRSLA
jgi:hypothetical protein